MTSVYSSWGGYPTVHQDVYPYRWPGQPLPGSSESSIIPHGNGRSYGDVCLNHGAAIVATRSLRRFQLWDPDEGILRAESGVLLSEVLELTMPDGWFLPVTPGTKAATLGGSIACDVHGKNHHGAGTFGCHVTRLGLQRSSGEVLDCSPNENEELFAATIGGMGLTGLVVWAELKMLAVPGVDLELETLRFKSLAEFADLSEQSDKKYQYTVAWIDATAPQSSTGRGHFMRANHANSVRRPARGGHLPPGKRRFPATLPFSCISRPSVKVFNTMYYHRPWSCGHSVVNYNSFFYPLDGVSDWNRAYGRSGFQQFQCVVTENHLEVIESILQDCANFSGSFLTVLKRFGSVRSPGFLSFPRPGYTLAIDIAQQGAVTVRQVRKWCDWVAGAGGAVYPAKDASMTADHFEAFYPQVKQFRAFVDPAFSSSFWRRVSKTEKGVT